MKRLTFTFTSAVVLIGTLMLCSESKGFVSGLFFVPFALGPLFVTLLLAACLPGQRAQKVLLASSILYAIWFTYGYLDIFYIHLDPNGALGLLIIGLFSLPVMAIFWVTAGFFQASSPKPN